MKLNLRFDAEMLARALFHTKNKAPESYFYIILKFMLFLQKKIIADYLQIAMTMHQLFSSRYKFFLIKILLSETITENYRRIYSFYNFSKQYLIRLLYLISFAINRKIY